GSLVYEEWFRQLLRDVELSIGEQDTLATWRDRYVLALLHDGTPERATSVLAHVRESWNERSGREETRGVARRLHGAVLTAAELAAQRERALDVLVARLVPRAQSAESAGKTSSSRRAAAEEGLVDDVGMIAICDAMRAVCETARRAAEQGRI